MAKTTAKTTIKKSVMIYPGLQVTRNKNMIYPGATVGRAKPMIYPGPAAKKK